MSGTISANTSSGEDTPIYNIRVKQNATFERAFKWSVTIDGTKRAVNIVGWSALLQVRDHAQGTVLFEASTANERIRIDGINGRILLRFEADDTANMKFRTGIWDIVLRSPVGSVRRMAQGRFDVDYGVSRFV